MTGKVTNPVSHFGRQLKKERLARGWSLPELSRRTGIDAGHLSRLENGKRPPTEAIALACDDVFPERRVPRVLRRLAHVDTSRIPVLGGVRRQGRAPERVVSRGSARTSPD